VPVASATISQASLQEMQRLFRLATQKLDDGKYEQAIEIYTTLLNLDPSIHEAYTNRGIAKYHLKSFQSAIQDFDMALKIKETDFWALAYRGIIHRESGNLQQAIDDFNRAIQIKPSESLFYYERAITKVLLNNYQSAIADLGKAISIEPKNLEFRLLKASLYRDTGNCLDAIQDYNAILKLDSRNSFAYLGRGICSITKNPQSAIKDFDTALKYLPSLTTVYKYRGLAYMLLNQVQQGCSDLAKAIQSDPGFRKSNPMPIYQEFLKAYRSYCK